MMRTLRDMNMSKFVAEDVPLFLSLIDDLFPGLKADRSSFPDVSRALEKVALEKGLQLHTPWLNKCIQLYETYLVRHGIMLVGPTGGGKSAIEECLAGALTELGTKHIIWRMNPKVRGPWVCLGWGREDARWSVQTWGGGFGVEGRMCAFAHLRPTRIPTRPLHLPADATVHTTRPCAEPDGAPDVWAHGRRHGRLDGRRVLRAVAPRVQEQEPKHVDRAGRARGACACRIATDPWAAQHAQFACLARVLQQP